jgi:hypothetical protein
MDRMTFQDGSKGGSVQDIGQGSAAADAQIPERSTWQAKRAKRDGSRTRVEVLATDGNEVLYQICGTEIESTIKRTSFLQAYERVEDSAPSGQVLFASPTGDILKVEIVQVTPAIAEQYKAKANPLNRGMSAAYVNRYAGDMRAGKWILTHQGIARGPDGTMLDGHHRIEAVIASGCTVPFMVTTFASEDAYKRALSAVDKGRVRRTGHILELLGHVEPGKGTVVAAIAHALDLLLNTESRTLSVDQVLMIYLRYHASFVWALENVPNHEFASPVRAAFIYAHSLYPKKVQEFTSLVVEKTGLVENTAAHRFVQTMGRLRAEAKGTKLQTALGGKGGRDGRRAAMLITLRALAGHIRGDTMHRLYPSDDGIEFFNAAARKAESKKGK